MKIIILLFILCLGFISISISQNFILAGQTIGTNIYYNDCEPDSTAIYPGDSEFLLDIENNGNEDLSFAVQYHNNANNYITWWTSVTELRNNIKIISQQNPESGYVKPLNMGDTISLLQDWNSDSISSIIFQYYFKINSTGEQVHHGTFSDGYLGFKIIHPTDTLFGWINIHATYETIIAKEIAFYGKISGTNGYSKSNSPYQVYPNPCKSQLNLSDYSAKHFNKRFEVTDVFGNKVKSGNASNENTVINTTELLPGLYFISIIDDNQSRTGFKFIHQNE